MDKLSNPLQNMIDAAAKYAAPSTTIATALQRHKARTESVHSGNSFILADISGSMSEMAGAIRKIDLLREALSAGGLDFSVTTIIAFHSFVEEVVAPGSIPEPRGSTALHVALDYLSPRKPMHTLVISDGHPDSRDKALAAADKVTGKIDVLYIGPDNDHEAISFMYQLAGRTGGRVTVNDVKKINSSPKQLGEKINQLLLK